MQLMVNQTVSLSFKILLKDWPPISVVKVTTFLLLGVKAVDDYTVEYTLNKPESFWNSKVTTGNYASS